MIANFYIVEGGNDRAEWTRPGFQLIWVVASTQLRLFDKHCNVEIDRRHFGIAGSVARKASCWAGFTAVNDGGN